MSIDKHIDSLSEEDREALARRLYRRGYGVKDAKATERALTAAVSAMGKLLRASGFSRTFVGWCRTAKEGRDNPHFLTYAETLHLVYISPILGCWVLTAFGERVAERMGCLPAYEYRMEVERGCLQR